MVTSTCPLAVKDVPPFTSGIRSLVLNFSPETSSRSSDQTGVGKYTTRFGMIGTHVVPSVALAARSVYTSLVTGIDLQW